MKTPKCPQCPTKDPRFFANRGLKYRKKDKIDKRSAVLMYQCTECGYKGQVEEFGIVVEVGE